jgi:hypothetical protein
MMNTRRALAAHIRAGGFREESFAYLDDCRTFHRSVVLNYLEISLWRVRTSFGTNYPETCLLGVSERLAEPT